MAKAGKEEEMEDQRPGAAYWIDHYIVPVSDVPRWATFAKNVVGPKPGGFAGQRQEAVQESPDAPPITFSFLAWCQAGGSAQLQALPASRGLGPTLPRYSYFVRPEEIDEHLRRLDRYQVPHTDAFRTSEEGEDGRAIRFEDPDGNPLEFWAPDRMPPGGMDHETPLRVGRIAGALFESRDLSRTADFYARYCGFDPVASSDIPRDTLVLKLAAGGKLAFKQVDALSGRTGGFLHTLHIALVVRHDEMMQAYRRMWAELPEWDHEPLTEPQVPPEEAEQLAARTGCHGAPIGPAWRAAFGRGNSLFDWDTNTYHLVAGAPVGGSMASYTEVAPQSYIDAQLASKGAR